VRYQQDLQVSLRERLRRLMVAHYSAAGTELRLAVDWINKQPALRAILAEAERAEPDLDFDAFDQALQNATGDFVWPCRSEEGRATLIWMLMQRITDAAAPERAGSSQDATFQYAQAVGWHSNSNDNWREFTERVLQPLFDYLTERVGAESSVLYVLERYVRRVEWFDRQGLYDRAMANSQKAEEVYDTDLRRFLFSEGINMPFSQAKSASGLSDVISELDTDDPLVCELKIFDGDSRGKRHLGTGVNQAIEYTTDYGKHSAYLVVINLSGRQLTLPSDGEPKIWPPYIDVARVRVHLVPVRALPTASASRRGRPAPVSITRADLVDPDTTDSAVD
jgi:hypothetical protein